jgi:hypothetical protein
MEESGCREAGEQSDKYLKSTAQAAACGKRLAYISILLRIAQARGIKLAAAQ